ncbi:hypothetical protein GPECTOR_6g647 [Gonium pectorale]|uniref:N-acetyltransferase domain-containing protein n=1 Tax=Gonium pectorale TaxID=33097 RepID=A0A150GWI2_GONPE|nr:hypothetical protein GPECTOR_6g647 [Gonium pectorale]|eukprot:KXZ53730.1 hypothetical protein GPECTOR_6g647 [Gonium pectorale]
MSDSRSIAVTVDDVATTIRIFSAADDPRAAAACAETIGEFPTHNPTQGFAVDPNNHFFCADPSLYATRWRAIASNALLRSPSAPMLHALGQQPAAVAFAYSYPEHKVPDDAPEPPGIIDTSATSRAETAPVLMELLAYLKAKRDEFHEARGPFEYIAFLAARPEWRGKGLGSQLLRFVTDNFFEGVQGTTGREVSR